MINNLKVSKKMITDLQLVQDGDSIHFPRRRIHLRHHTGNQAATGSQLGAGIRGEHHPGPNSKKCSSLIVQRCHVACRKFNLLAIDGRCKQMHLPHAIIECVQLFTLCLHSFARIQVMLTMTYKFLLWSARWMHEIRCISEVSNWYREEDAGDLRRSALNE